MPVFAAETDEAALARAETILFGEQVQGGELNDRLVRVEKRIFGRRKAGSDEERIERITSTLLIDRAKLKVTKTAEEVQKKADSSSEPVAEKPPEKPAENLSEKQAEIQSEKQPQIQSEKQAERQPENLPEKQAEAVPEKQPDAASEKRAEPVAQSQPEPTVQHKAQQQAVEKPIAVKGKGKKVAKQTQKTAGKSDKNHPVANKQPEVILKQETASLDARKEEKRSSVMDTPASYTSSSSNRISRGNAPKVHQAANLLREGMEAHRRGEDVKAEQLFKKAVVLEPRNPDGYFNLGALAEKKKDLAGALMSYRAALNLNPNDREIKEAVESVESMLGVETSDRHQVAGTERGRAGDVEQDELRSAEARSAQIREFYAKDSAARERAAMESSDRFESPPGTYGFGHSGHTAHNGPAPAPNFYRARAKTTRELQEEAAPFVDVNDPDAPVMSVSPPQTPVANTGQPQPFQLQTQRSQAAMQANQHKRPSAAGTATRAILGVALSVGTSYALRSSGLHCPICRIGGGGGALRGLLRF